MKFSSDITKKVLGAAGGLLLLVAIPALVHAWTITIYPFTYTSVVYGGYTTISWDAHVGAADYCDISGPYFVNGNERFYGQYGSKYVGPITGSYQYVAYCVNVDDGGGGGNGSNSLTVNPIYPTTISSFTASPSTLPNVNSGTTLNWSATAGTYYNGCVLSGGQYGSGVAVGVNGPTATAALSNSTQYTLTCNDSYTGAVSRNTTVLVGSTVSTGLSAAVNPIDAGQNATLNYYADSATAPTGCRIYNSSAVVYDGAACPASANASYTVPSSYFNNTPGTYLFRLFYNQSGWVDSGKQVTITVRPSCTLSSNYSQINYTGQATLTYTANSANSATIDQGVGALPQTAGTVQTRYITSSGNWPVPLDWSNVGNNTVEVIAGGAGAYNGLTGASGAYGALGAAPNAGAGGAGGAGGYGGGGGGGGAYSKSTFVSLTPGNTAYGYVGGGGTPGGVGGDSYFCSSTSNCANIAGSAVVAGAKGGGVGGAQHLGGTGGQASAGVASGAGSVKYNGGNGAGGSAGTAGTAGSPPYPPFTGYPYNTYPGSGGSGGYGNYGGGGGGAAGPHGAGGNASTYIGGVGDAGYTAATANGGATAGYAGGGGQGATANGAPGAGGAGQAAYYVAPNAGGYGSAGTATGYGSGNYGAGGSGGSGGGGGGGGGGSVSNSAYPAAVGGAGGGGGAGVAGKAGLITINYYPANVPGGTIASTPITLSPTTFTMTVTNAASGQTNTCSTVPITITDVCGDITGFQSVAPASPCAQSVTQNGTCVPQPGYTWNGSACIPVVTQPTNLSIWATASRVRRGSPASLNYSMQNPSGTCTITAPGYSSGSFAASASGGHVTTGFGIQANTVFTLTCGTASASASVGVLQSFIEQ